MISDSHHFLFIDIVKTAGTSVGEVLSQYGGEGKHHAIARPLPALLENRGLSSPVDNSILDQYFCFTFTRNPYARLVSLFSYCQTAPLQERFAANGWQALETPAHRPRPETAHDRKNYWPTALPTFIEWLLEHDSYYNDFHGEKYIPMRDWVVDASGTVRVEFIGQQETLQQDFDKLAERIGIEKTQLPTANRSEQSISAAAWETLRASKDLQSIVREFYAQDFELFGYSTDIDACKSQTAP